ncbi:TIR domain-containing protein [Roseiconus lacunae]|uniref:TIR domain-containing protein n=1 Tax=Roseiconus lacunae TaxID=2605694 RepID=UPI0011F261E2|nr:TIR domain-containing protein [Roseiconus lacunae]
MATKVFISWSGELSRQLAEAVREWLPGALQFVKPYFTPEDIEKGARWGSDIVNELESSDIGIVCLTHANTDSPWILFEAGALSKSLEKSRVCGVLFGLDTTDLKGPLTIFQHTRFQRSDFKKLVKTINAAGGDAKLDDNVFDSVFDMWWPRLEEKVNHILNSVNPDGEASNRSERDMLEEILELSRLNTRNRKSERELPFEIIVELIEGVEMMIMKGGVRSVHAMRFIERPLMMLADYSGHPEMHEMIFRLRKRMEMERKPAKDDE